LDESDATTVGQEMVDSATVLLLMDENATPLQEADQRLAQTVAGFLGKQMES
jgi:hypothetical protein